MAGYYVDPQSYAQMMRDRALSLLKFRQSASMTDYNLGMALQTKKRAQRDLRINAERELDSFSTPYAEAGLNNSGIQNLAFTRRAEDLANAEADILSAYEQTRAALLMQLQQEREGIATEAALSVDATTADSAKAYADLVKSLGGTA